MSLWLFETETLVRMRGDVINARETHKSETTQRICCKVIMEIEQELIRRGWLET